MGTIGQDVRYALRLFRKAPGFSVVAAGTLALGIGANAALFSVVEGVLLRPLPFAEPERLVVVWETQLQRGLPFMYASPPNYADWSEQNRVFEAMAVFDTGPLFLAEAGEEAARIQGARVSASMFDLLGAAPLLGRGFTPEEDRPGGGGVVVLGHALWMARFGGDPGVLGRRVLVDETPHTVVGVMPAGFTFPPPVDLEGSQPYRRSELWVPLAREMAGGQRGAHYLTAIARLAPGVTRERATAEMVTIAGRLAAQYPDSNDGWSITLVPLEEQVLGPFRTALLVLLGAVGFVLLIACVNVANLLLARGAGRMKECAIRAALGAGRGRLARQLLTESTVLALIGGTAGLVLGSLILPLLLGSSPANVPRVEEVGIDRGVIGFTLLTTLLTAALFGVLPALQLSRSGLESWLRRGGRGGSVRMGGRLRAGLVIAEVALSLVLLVGAGLLLRSFLHLQGVDPGFRAEQVLTLRVSLPRNAYPERDGWAPRFAQLEREVAAVPGVAAAGFVLDLPLGDDRQGTTFRFVQEAEGDPDDRQVNFSFVTPGYFAAMGIPLRRGRAFTPSDDPEREPVVVVNDAFAARFLTEGGDDRILPGFRSQVPARIVGVVGGVRHDSLDREPAPTIYAPYAQVPWNRTLTLAVRADGAPQSIASSIRARLRELEPAAPLYDVRTMDEVVAQSVANPRFSMAVLGAFAALATLLAAVGIYGVISYTVARATREFGLRMALGARPVDVLRLVVGKGLALVGIGLLVGLAASLALTRVMGSLLHGVSVTDPLTFAGLSILLAGIALLASYLPARRAARVDPMIALRDE